MYGSKLHVRCGRGKRYDWYHFESLQYHYNHTISMGSMPPPPLCATSRQNRRRVFTPGFLQKYHGKRPPHHRTLNVACVLCRCSISCELWHASTFLRTNATFTQIQDKVLISSEFWCSYTVPCMQKKNLERRAGTICSGWAFTPVHLHLCRIFSQKWGWAFTIRWAFTPYFTVHVVLQLQTTSG